MSIEQNRTTSGGDTLPAAKAQPSDSGRDRLFAEFAASTEATTTRASRPAATGQPNQAWTMAIDLTTTLYSSENQPEGALHQFQALQALVADSKNSPVSFVVQQAREVQQPPTVPAGSPQDSAPQSPAPPGTSDNKNGLLGHYELDRYLIRNGQMTALGSSPSQGMGTDLQGLLATAQEQAPAEHLGLIIQSHGAVAEGLQSDVGRLSLPALRDTIHAGLAGSNHDHLDFLDFDACSMSSVNVINSLRGVADAVVASAETESSFGNADAQNLTALGRDLLRRPQMSGLDIATDAVRLAREGANNNTLDETSRGQSGTPDLEAIDMKAAPAFNQSLDGFGAALNSAWSQPGNRDTLNTLISQDPRYSSRSVTMGDSPRGQDRDLLTFANSVQDAIKAGKLADPEGLLAQSTQALISAHGALVPAHFGEASRNFENRGGVSTDLPDAEVRDFMGRAIADSPVGSLDAALKSTKRSAFRNHAYFAAEVKDVGDEFARAGETQVAEQLRRHSQALAQSQTEQQYDAAKKALETDLPSMQNSDVNQKAVREHAQAMQRREQQSLDGRAMSDTPNWQSFLSGLLKDPGRS